MHASILATMRGTPTITINSQPKLRGYMRMIHQENWACDVRDFTIEKAKQMLSSILVNSGEVRENLGKAKHEVGNSALIAARYLKDIYDRKQKKMAS